MAQLHSAHEAASWLRAQVRGRLCTDSRQVQAGDCFVALRGERFDGHDHLAQAVAGGVAEAVRIRPRVEFAAPGELYQPGRQTKAVRFVDRRG